MGLHSSKMGLLLLGRSSLPYPLVKEISGNSESPIGVSC